MCTYALPNLFKKDLHKLANVDVFTEVALMEKSLSFQVFSAEKLRLKGRQTVSWTDRGGASCFFIIATNNEYVDEKLI